MSMPSLVLTVFIAWSPWLWSLWTEVLVAGVVANAGEASRRPHRRRLSKALDALPFAPLSLQRFELAEVFPHDRAQPVCLWSPPIPLELAGETKNRNWCRPR